MTPAKKLLSYSYYPGCSLHASAKEYDESTRGLFKALGIGLQEVPDWLCCGATPAHNVDELLSLSLCAKNLSLAEGVEGDLAVACAACFSRLKVTQHHLADNETKRKQVEYAIDGTVNLAKPVKHLLEILAKDFGLDRLTEAVQKPLAGLKVACYYGCLLTRPPEVPQLDCVEAPTIMERVIGAVGAETVAGATGWSAAAPTSPCRAPAWSSSSPAVSSIPPRPPAPTASWSPAPCATATWTSGRKRSRRPQGSALACRSST